ncbi:MAG: tetratricopeptide repeat protein [Candidatus Riflebacteria bacterium]|nr:tetratricopeptide repeat protein [Candidatus Riflebacteria bacterium]
MSSINLLCGPRLFPNASDRSGSMKYIRRVLSLLAVLLMLSCCAPVYSEPYDDYLKVGRDHFGLFHFPDARTNFQKAVDLDGTRSEGWYYLGMTLRKLNDNTGAVKAFEKAIAISPDETDCQKALSELYLQFGKDCKQANNRAGMIENLKKAVLTYPKNTPIVASLFNIWGKDASWDQITAIADKVKTANQEGIEAGDDKNLQAALVWVARAYIERKEPGRARAYLNAAGMIKQPNDELARLIKLLPQETKTVAGSVIEECRALIDKGQYKIALDKLKKAQQADTSNTEIDDLVNLTQKKLSTNDFLKEADEAERAGKFDQALEFVNRAIGIDDENTALRDRAASLSIKLEEFEKKQAHIKSVELDKRQAQLNHSQKLASLLKVAHENEVRRAYDVALINFEQALTLDPENGELKASIERVRTAAAGAKEQMEKAGKNFSRASKLIEQGKYDEAFALLKEMAEEKSFPLIQVYPCLIECCLSMERLDDADSYCEKLAKLATASDELTYFQGSIALKRDKYAEAGEALFKIYGKNPTFKPDLGSLIWQLRFQKYKYGIILLVLFIGWKLFFWLKSLMSGLSKATQEGRIEQLLARGKYEAVIPIIETRLSSGDSMPNRRALILSLADACLRTKRYQNAKERALEVINKDPKNPVAARILGEAFFQLGETSPEAMERIQNLFKVDESRRDVLTFLIADVKRQNSDSKTAIDLLHKQVSMFPEDLDTVIYLAGIYTRRSLYNAVSMRIFERAMKHDPERSEYAYGYAQSLMQTGRKEEAEKLLAAGAQRWPDNEQFQRVATPGRQPSGDNRLQTPGGNTGGGDASVTGSGGGNRSEATTQRITTRPTIKMSAPSTAPQGGESTVCKSCGTANSLREYYCTKCGKPLS